MPLRALRASRCRQPAALCRAERRVPAAILCLPVLLRLPHGLSRSGGEQGAPGHVKGEEHGEGAERGRGSGERQMEVQGEGPPRFTGLLSEVIQAIRVLPWVCPAGLV